MKRWWLSAVVLVLGSLLALFLAAGVNPSLPWSPERAMQFAPHELSPMGARLEYLEDGSAVFAGADALGRSLLVARELDLDAGQFPVVRYEFNRFPATLKLVLVWRSSLAPERLRSSPVPRPARGLQRVEFGSVEGWEGRISEVGLLVLPADLLPAQATAERQFALRQFGLESASQSGAVASLLTEWTAYRPWVGRSINVTGFELGLAQRQTLVWFAAALVVVLGLALWLLPLMGLRRWGAFVVAAALAWVILDLLHLAQLHWRNDFTRQAQLAAEESQVDPRLAAVRGGLRPILADIDPRLVLVSGQSAFHRTYGAFRLLPLPVAAVESAPVLPDGEQRLALVVIGKGVAEFDADANQLQWGHRRYAAQRVFEQTPVQAFRLMLPAETVE